MKHRRVRWSRLAKGHLADLISYIEEASGSIDVALNYADRLEARCLSIGEAPLSGRIRDDLAPGLRSVPFERSAIVFYVVEADHVLIASVYSRGRDYEKIVRGDEAPLDEAED